MKKSQILKNETNPRVYKLTRYKYWRLCCSPHKGCNKSSYHRNHPVRSWKTYRNHQWK